MKLRELSGYTGPDTAHILSLVVGEDKYRTYPASNPYDYKSWDTLEQADEYLTQVLHLTNTLTFSDPK
jgi:hypothetical protein